MNILFSLLALFALITMVVGLVKPSMVNSMIKKELSRKKILAVFASLFLLMGIMSGLTTPPTTKIDYAPNPTVAPIATPNQTVAKTSATPENREFFQIKVNRDRGNVINYKLLIAQENNLEAEEIASNFYKKCPKQCTVDIYDDEKALNLNEEYDQMYMNSNTTPAELKNWETKNYVFVADHYIGRIDFDGEFFDIYPYKDSRYKELGGKI